MEEVVVGASEGAVDGTDDERETGAAAGVPSTDCWAGERIEPKTL